ncbi:phospholipase D-like domain-containing protein [Mastigocoleus testarum]|uniref:Cardiolipin synthetase n=1 Tax=Mastigocoleus testarum BC008 TaxID=371196 RepID=A0A0V7ZZU3_9CYAN|nr:phosphatidylserine/phosphatidylglycerophosphate/cardiolipin synthase family protein [Mastigocoleus testarum]KST69998.1 cardiolipin synthetase [Mastigocoleus testarum BC008]
MFNLLGWLIASIFIALVIVILVLYLRGFFHLRIPYQICDLPSPKAKNFASTMAGLSDSFITEGKITNFCVFAEQIFAYRLEAISKASKSIQFETFIMTPGRRANEFALALAEKAQSGVKVQVLADHYGAKEIPSKYWSSLKSSGVEVLFFNRFSWRDPFYYLRRNHRKLLLVDNKIALIGGAGISDYWDGRDGIGDKTPWFDYEVCLQGSIIERLKNLFIQHWLDAGGSANFSEENFKFNQENQQTILIDAGEDPTLRDSGIRSLFQSLIAAARKRVWIASPYFLPNRNSRDILIRAKRKGIDVRILTMGPRTDKPPVRFASLELFSKLIKSDISIYEYQASMMHAKAMLIDDCWVSIGSANFDPRSFFHNDELNLLITEYTLTKRIEDFFLDGFSRSHSLTLKNLKHRPLKEKLLGRLMLLFFWQL